MIVSTETVDLDAGDGVMRCLLARPRAEGRYPGIVLYSDIFQLTGPMVRSCVRLAGYGYTVLAPEIYRRREPPGTVIPFDDDGRTRGLDHAAATPVAHFDADARLAVGWLGAHPAVEPGRIGAAGFCIGGHLAFRAALLPQVRATVCFYGTGIHNGKLGADADALSLQRAAEIRGRLLLVWGLRDPHIPAEGRAAIEAGLRKAGTAFEQTFHDAEHAFMRDEGPRFDPQATDRAHAEAVAFLDATLRG